MGCFMSKPDTRVYYSEGMGKNFTYATGSCQGWRREQEDAEVCLPYFDEDASLFVLCDGHGGAEVAKYTVKHLPDFIKNHKLYKEKQYEKCLHDAFVEFDALLRTDKVLDELTRMAFDNEEKEEKEGKVINLDGDMQPESSEPSGSAAGTSSSTKNGPTTVVEDVEVDALRKEAQVPLTDLIEVYSDKVGLDPAKKRSLMLNYHASPIVKSKETDKEEKAENNGDTTNISSSDKPESKSSSSKQSGDEPEQGPSTSGQAELASDIREIFQRYFSDEDSSDDSEFNGAEDDDDEDGDDEDDDQGSSNSSKRLRRKKHKRPSDDYDSTSDDYSEDNEDESSEDDGEDSDEEDDEEKAESNSDEEDDTWGIPEMMKANTRQHRPGFDSGCTVVVTLITKDRIFVASAGDSRCILVNREGLCTPMCFDHKPSDPIERRRILKAGGKVQEGRVNGGLNLSRAFGDFTYKSANLPAEEQMITPCPDIKTRPFDPKDIEYVLLACDGIWNSMENDDVANQIHTDGSHCKVLVQLCLGLFQSCIAPSTDGDGTGCDNMTCIVARFHDPTESENLESDLSKSVLKPDANKTPSTKRLNVDRSDDTPTKRRCIQLWTDTWQDDLSLLESPPKLK